MGCSTIALVYGGGYSDDVLARARSPLRDRSRQLADRVVLLRQAYAVDLGQIHQDTAGQLTGAYEKQQRRAVQLLRGFSMLTVRTCGSWSTSFR